MEKRSALSSFFGGVEEMKDWDMENKQDIEKKEKVQRKFGAGVLTGVLVTVVLICGVWGAWRMLSVIFRGDYTSADVSEADVDSKLDQISGLIDEYYLYDDEIDKDDLINGIYSGYASALGDPYTEYYDEEETKALYESTSGEFSGIGATMSKSMDSDEITVSNVYEDSPAAKAGMKAGDVIIQVDDHSVSGQDLETVVSWIKGERGTDVVLHVLRDGEELELTATRDIIEVHTVDYEMTALYENAVQHNQNGSTQSGSKVNTRAAILARLLPFVSRIRIMPLPLQHFSMKIAPAADDTE